MSAIPEWMDPIAWAKPLWPHVEFHGPQIDMIYGVRDSMETYVVAGNKLGKDFTAGFICVSFFLCPQLYFHRDYVMEVEKQGKGHHRRIVTTSVAADHLRVLWAEIGYFLSTCATVNLINDKDPRGPPLLYLTEMELRFRKDLHLKRPPNYLIGAVAEAEEKLAGHHAPYTLAIGDESSGLEDYVYKQFQGWAKRMLYFGNPNPTQNFFRRNYQQGDLLATGGSEQ